MEQAALELIRALHHTIEIIAVVVIPFEVILLMLVHRRWFHGDTGVNLLCGALIGIFYYWLFAFSPVPVLDWLKQLRIAQIDHSLLSIIAHVLIGDLCFYIFHRVAHTRYLFALDHSVHHSSRELDFTTNLRNSLMAPLYAWWPLVIPTLLGFDPLLLLASFTLANAIPFFCHTRHIGKLGWLEYIFNTPSHHRVHHGRNACYIDKNFGGMLIIWDRMFGTFAEENEPVKYGIAGIKTDRKIWEVQLAGLRLLKLSKSPAASRPILKSMPPDDAEN